jgi:hypothetical protein
MTGEIQRLIEEYLAWLKDKTALRQVKDWVEITTPYLDRHNDYLQIYAKRENGHYLLTDGGETIEDLRLSGCPLDSPRRQELLHLTLNGFGVRLNKETLEVHASPQNFGPQKHNLLQAMLAVNDLFYVASPIIKSLFLEDVIAWLELHAIRYVRSVKFTGKSGYDHHFDFVIPKSVTRPERILQALGRPRRDTAITTAFAWFDTRDVRPPDSRAFAILNDSEQSVPAEVIDALRNYDVSPVFWSKREDVREELAN